MKIRILREDKSNVTVRVVNSYKVNFSERL